MKIPKKLVDALKRAMHSAAGASPMKPRKAAKKAATKPARRRGGGGCICARWSLQGGEKRMNGHHPRCGRLKLGI